jgi:hypothetical protein
MHGRHHTSTRNSSTERSRQKRRLAKETRRDPVSYSDLPLPASIRGELIKGLIGAGLVVRRGADEVDMTTAKWRKRSGLLIAQAIVRMLVQNNGDALRYERFLSFIIAELRSFDE